MEIGTWMLELVLDAERYFAAISPKALSMYSEMHPSNNGTEIWMGLGLTYWASKDGWIWGYYAVHTFFLFLIPPLLLPLSTKKKKKKKGKKNLVLILPLSLEEILYGIYV